MRTPEQCREEAAKCQQLADELSDPVQREIILETAARWLALANGEDGTSAADDNDGARREGKGRPQPNLRE